MPKILIFFNLCCAQSVWALLVQILSNYQHCFRGVVNLHFMARYQNMSYRLHGYKVHMMSALSLCRFSILQYLWVDFLYRLIECIVGCRAMSVWTTGHILQMSSACLMSAIYQASRELVLQILSRFGTTSLVDLAALVINTGVHVAYTHHISKLKCHMIQME
jgi:hypothetical protein